MTVRSDIRRSCAPIIDALAHEIGCARGIEAALCGLLYHEPGEMISGILRLQQDHIDHLDQIKLDLYKFKDGDQPQSPAEAVKGDLVTP